MKKISILLLTIISIFTLTGCSDKQEENYIFSKPITTFSQVEDSYMEEYLTVPATFTTHLEDYYVDNFIEAENQYILFCEGLNGAFDKVIIFDKEFNVLKEIEFGRTPHFHGFVDNGFIVVDRDGMSYYLYISFDGETEIELGTRLEKLPNKDIFAIQSRYVDVPDRIIKIENDTLVEMYSQDKAIMFYPTQYDTFMALSLNEDNTQHVTTIDSDGIEVYTETIDSGYLELTYSGFVRNDGEELTVKNHIGEVIYTHTFDETIRFVVCSGAEYLHIELENSTYVLNNEWKLEQLSGASLTHVYYETEDYVIGATRDEWGDRHIVRLSHDNQTIVWQFDENTEYEDAIVTDDYIYINNFTETAVYDHDKNLIKTLPFGGLMLSDKNGYIMFDEVNEKLVSYDTEYNIIEEFDNLQYSTYNITEDRLYIRARHLENGFSIGIGIYIFDLDHNLVLEVFEEGYSSFLLTEVDNLYYVSHHDLSYETNSEVHVYNQDNTIIDSYTFLGTITDDIGTYSLLLKDNTLYKLYY